jgi:hypothetical protein
MRTARDEAGAISARCLQPVIGVPAAPTSVASSRGEAGRTRGAPLVLERRARKRTCDSFLGVWEGYTFLRAPPDRHHGLPELLLERTSQLQTALDSRVAVERATGFLAGKLDLSFEQAFALLRQTARSRRIRLHDLADRVVAKRSIPKELRADPA